MQNQVNLVDLVKSFPTNIYLQNLASIQKRTSPIKFAQLAEKSENGSISNLSTKVETTRVRVQRVSHRKRSDILGDQNLFVQRRLKTTTKRTKLQRRTNCLLFNPNWF